MAIIRDDSLSATSSPPPPAAPSTSTTTPTVSALATTTPSLAPGVTPPEIVKAESTSPVTLAIVVALSSVVCIAILVWALRCLLQRRKSGRARDKPHMAVTPLYVPLGLDDSGLRPAERTEYQASLLGVVRPPTPATPHSPGHSPYEPSRGQREQDLSATPWTPRRMKGYSHVFDRPYAQGGI